MLRNYLSLTCITTALLLSAATGAAAQTKPARADVARSNGLHHYQAVRALLFAGVPVTAIFTPGECSGPQPAAKAAIPAVSGGFVVRDFIEVIGSNIGFSNQHLTLRPDGTTVLELVQYRVLPDDTATVKTNFLSPVTYQPVSAPLSFQCAIGHGLEFVAY